MLQVSGDNERLWRAGKRAGGYTGKKETSKPSVFSLKGRDNGALRQQGYQGESNYVFMCVIGTIWVVYLQAHNEALVWGHKKPGC